MSSFDNPILTVLIGTRNRLPILKLCLSSLLGKNSSIINIVVVDAGSTDGTIEYVQSLKEVKLVCDGEPIGQAQSLNRVLKTIGTQYICWISDDNVVQPGAIDEAISILLNNPEIGMVALKVKDISGGRESKAYIGGIRPSGILTCNQGMLPLALFKKIGFFDEEYRDYGIDAELTARVLLEGKKVVFTKRVAIHHLRDHHEFPGAIEKEERLSRISHSYKLFSLKHPELENFNFLVLLNRKCWMIIYRLFNFFYSISPRRLSNSEILHDLNNVCAARFISKLDLWYCRKKKFYLVQSISSRLIKRL